MVQSTHRELHHLPSREFVLCTLPTPLAGAGAWADLPAKHEDDLRLLCLETEEWQDGLHHGSQRASVQLPAERRTRRALLRPSDRSSDLAACDFPAPIEWPTVCPRSAHDGREPLVDAVLVALPIPDDLKAAFAIEEPGEPGCISRGDMHTQSIRLNPEYVRLARDRIIADAPLLNTHAEAA